MTVVTTDCPYPPQGTQIKAGPGTLVSVVVPQPIVTSTGNNQPPAVTAMTGSTPLRASFYDAANAAGATGTPLVSIDTAQGYSPVTLNLSFTKGLYCAQHSPSAIAVTTA